MSGGGKRGKVEVGCCGCLIGLSGFLLLVMLVTFAARMIHANKSLSTNHVTTEKW